MTDGSRRWWLTLALLGAVIGAHFGVILLTIAPVPWIPPFISAAGYRYVEPLFRQGWWLFAPDPPVFEHAVSIRGLNPSQSGEAPTPWLDVTAPLIRSVQADRFAPEGTRLSAVLFSTFSLLNPTTLQLDTSGAAVPPVLESVADQPASLVALQRAGVIELRKAFPGSEFEAIQIKLTLRRLPHVSLRHQPLAAPEVEVEFAAVPFPSMSN